MKLVFELVSLAKNLVEVVTKIRSADREGCVRAADFLKKVAECLGNLGEAYRSNDHFGLSRFCGELKMYGYELERILPSYLEKERAQQIHRQWRRTLDIPGQLVIFIKRPNSWMEYDDLTEEDIQAALHQLEEAIGQFRACANILQTR